MKINIPVGTGPNTKENILKIENKLKKKGIHFEAEWTYKMESFVPDRREWFVHLSMLKEANNLLQKNKVEFWEGY